MHPVVLGSLPKNWTPWSGLKLFQNVEWVTEKLIDQRKLESTHTSNARKQANQISFAISQAKEYWNAARSSSLATAPLQLYYCCMSLALAEILWRGDGNHSLDKLRERNGHHGLEFKLQNRKLSIEELSSVVAKPHIRSGRRQGTFDTWHQFAREAGLVGHTTDEMNGFVRLEVLFFPAQSRLPFLPEEGVSLEILYANLPRLRNALQRLGLNSNTVRTSITKVLSPSNFDGFRASEVYSIVVHPERQELLKAFQCSIKANANYIEDIEIEDRGHSFTLRSTSHTTSHGRTGNLSVPDGISMSAGATYFKPLLPSLNEFGILYVTSYLLGMLCRYYPDVWMREIQSQSSFIYLAETFLEFAIDRAPLLCLNSLEDCIYVVDDMGMKH